MGGASTQESLWVVPCSVAGKVSLPVLCVGLSQDNSGKGPWPHLCSAAAYGGG